MWLMGKSPLHPTTRGIRSASSYVACGRAICDSTRPQAAGRVGVEQIVATTPAEPAADRRILRKPRARGAVTPRAVA